MDGMPKIGIPTARIERAGAEHPLITIHAAAQALGFRTLGLLGARVTMEGGFYPAVFSRRGLSVIIPEEPDRRIVDERYFGELVHGTFREDTRVEISQVVDRLIERGVDAVILGGTELPLLFRAGDLPRAPTLDTTAIHVAAAVERLLA